MVKKILICCCSLLWGISEILPFLYNFQKEEICAIFLRRVKSHWYFMSSYVSVINVAMWGLHLWFNYQQYGLHHNVITSSAGTSISTFPNARSEVRPQQIRHCFASHRDHLNSRTDHIFLLCYVKDSVSLLPLPQDMSAMETDHRCHRRNRWWRAAADMGWNGLSAWRLPWYNRRTHTALMRYAKKKITCRIFPSIWYNLSAT
jgi:hypothetical protein